MTLPTDSHALIEGVGLSKRYRRSGRMRDLLRRDDGGEDDLWVLRDVDLFVRPGDAWGLVGLNGAGKSTLLKIVAGVTTATTGSLAVRGRLGALLELGAGFHPEYSGRDNAYLAAAMLGLPQRELRSRLEAIEEFAALGAAFERPVRTYSSGMFTRLAFSVATAVEPAILVTDEVLAVGDEPFQKRCIRKIESFLGGGGTLLFCSHSMYHVRKLCRMAIWMDHGRVRLRGPVAEVVDAYESYLRSLEAPKLRGPATRPDGSFQSRMVSVELRTPAGDVDSSEVPEFPMGTSLSVSIEVETPPGDAEIPVIAVGCVRNDGVAVYGVFTDIDGIQPVKVADQRFRITYELVELSLLPGQYTLRMHVLDASGLRMFDTLEREFVVRGDTRELGVCRLRHRWVVD